MAEDLSANAQEIVPRMAVILGGLGLIPFVLGTFFEIAGGPGWAGPAFRYYAATILAFMGGIHWGLAMSGNDAQRGEESVRLQLICSIIPPLIGWFALLMPTTRALLVMAVAFTALLGGDLLAARRGWAPAWYPRLRMPLTATVVLCLLLAALV